MIIHLIRGNELTPELAGQWTDIQRADSRLDSPFFRPEFTQAVAAVRGDVEVAVIERQGVVVGFLPFQRERRRSGLPVGSPLSDFQGLILRSDANIESNQLLRGCGLSAWHFDHLPASQTTFRRDQWILSSSPYIDTSAGFDAYRAERRRAGSQILTRCAQKLRKLEREVGPMRVEIGIADETALALAMKWKAHQYKRSGLLNAFSPQWVQQLFRNLLRREDNAFRGMLFGLYVNDELQSALYCLRSDRVLHGWLAAYGQQLAKYSPGSQLWVEVIRSAQALGVDRIEMGNGGQPYKASFMSGATQLAAGSLDTRLATRSLRFAWQQMRWRVGQSPLRGPLTSPWRWLKRAAGHVQF